MWCQQSRFAATWEQLVGVFCVCGLRLWRGTWRRIWCSSFMVVPLPGFVFGTYGADASSALVLCVAAGVVGSGCVPSGSRPLALVPAHAGYVLVSVKLWIRWRAPYVARVLFLLPVVPLGRQLYKYIASTVVRPWWGVRCCPADRMHFFLTLHRGSALLLRCWRPALGVHVSAIS